MPLIDGRNGGEVVHRCAADRPTEASRGCEASVTSEAARSAEKRRPPLDLAEASRYLNVNVRYVRRLVAERRVRYLKVGRLLRFRADDLDDYLESCGIEPRAVSPSGQRR